jgi:hypothetical protein
MTFASEDYESELERMNTSMAAENQSLQYDNKQLNALIKEYEQTLETVMSTFRNRAVCAYLSFLKYHNPILHQRDVQERELSLIREYEAKLLVREEENVTRDLDSSTAVSESLARLSHVLRQLLRYLGGECLEQKEGEGSEEDREPWNATTAAQHALERECELARLEKENEELRGMFAVGHDGRRSVILDPARVIGSPSPRPPNQSQAGDGGIGTVRPFGLYKPRLPS